VRGYQVLKKRISCFDRLSMNGKLFNDFDLSTLF